MILKLLRFVVLGIKQVRKVGEKMIQRIKNSLRLKIAIISIATLILACLLSLGFVIGGFLIVHNKPITPRGFCILSSLVCVLSILIGGYALWQVSRFIVAPIKRLEKGVKAVTAGNFNVVIDYRDLDEIGQLAHDFNLMTAELKGMDYLQKDFMSNVSHEVKTPVAAIMGFAEVLHDGGLNEAEQKEYLTYLQHESHRLSRLCDNMLKLSRLDNQAMVTHQRSFDLAEQLRQCVIVLDEKWQSKEMEYDLDVFSYSIHQNYDLLYQVWLNLLDNAIKFSLPKGKIYLKMIQHEESVTIIIQDEGIGISKDNQQKIFDKFYQCDESHKKEGNGLGLSIVKRILELIGGEILYESKESIGTTVTIILKR